MKRKIWVPADGEMREGLNVLKKTENRLEVRVICHEQLRFKGEDQENRAPATKEWETIMVYLHGGAFMGGSSRAA